MSVFAKLGLTYRKSEAKSNGRLWPNISQSSNGQFSGRQEMQETREKSKQGKEGEREGERMPMTEENDVGREEQV